MADTPNWIDAAGEHEVEDDACVARSLNGIAIVLVHSGGEWFALHDLCTHGSARLSDGYVEQGCIECPLHQGLVDLRTGEARSAPIIHAVKTFPVRVIEGRVQVAV